MEITKNVKLLLHLYYTGMYAIETVLSLLFHILYFP